MVIGSKTEVWNGSADKTSGGLTKGDLMINQRGKVVSIAKHKAGEKQMKRMLRSPHAHKFKANQDRFRMKSRKSRKSTKSRK